MRYIPHTYSNAPFGQDVPEHTELDMNVPAPFLWSSLTPRAFNSYLPNTYFPAGGNTLPKEVISVPGHNYVTNSIILNNFFLPPPFPLLNPVGSNENHLQRDGRQENKEINYKQSSSKDVLPLGTKLMEEIDNSETQPTSSADTPTNGGQLNYSNQPGEYIHTGNSPYY